MKRKFKELIWDAWAPIIAILSIVDWTRGELSGFWAWVVCFLAAGYFIACLQALTQRQGHPR